MAVRSGNSGGLYDDPVIYDLLQTPGTAREVDGLEQIARLWLPARPADRNASTSLWLEPACGTGRYLRRLAARGRRVVGFDSSPRMVQYARSRLRGSPLARVVRADMTQFAAALGSRRPSFAFNLHNTIRHLESDDAMLEHFEQMANVLRPRALYAVGLSLTRYGAESPDEDLWEARRGRVAVRQLVQYLPPGSLSMLDPAPRRRRDAGRFERVVSHLVIDRPGRTEHRDDAYRLRCYDIAQWERLVRRSALLEVALVDWRGTRVTKSAVPYSIHLLRAR